MDVRFIANYNGEAGQYWQNDALKKISSIRKEYEDGLITVDDNGVAYNRIGRVVMDDIATVMIYAHIPFDYDATTKARHEANERAFEQYRKNNTRELSAEEMSEMRAAFGSGTTVVNVITGQRIKL